MPWGCLRFVIVVFPDNTHLLFLSLTRGNYENADQTPLTLPCALPNNFSILTGEDCEHSESRSPEPSPSVTQHRPVHSKIFKFRVLNMNCQSLVNKKAEFHALFDLHKPDIVIGT